LPHAAACHDQPRKLARWHEELLEAIASVRPPYDQGDENHERKNEDLNPINCSPHRATSSKKYPTANATAPPLNRVPFLPGIFSVFIIGAMPALSLL
jgi:hypothetical protein